MLTRKLDQSTVPYSTLNITLPRSRQVHSISLALLADVERGGVVDCPAGIRVVDGRSGKTVAFKDPWDDCIPNALNTVPFSNPAKVPANTTTPDADYTIETDWLQVTLSDKLRYTTAVSEVQIWVEPNMGPRYEAEDGLIGTFIGSFEGRATGLNGTVENGGVSLQAGGWVETADVRTSDGGAGPKRLTVIGGGQGTVHLQLNWLTNQTMTFSGDSNKTVTVDMLRGGNVVTIFQVTGTPFIDAIVVES